VGDNQAQATVGSKLLDLVVPGAITILGGVIVAAYQHCSQAHEQQVEDARAAASASAQALQQDQAVRQQNRAAQMELLRDLAPKVLGSTGSPQNCPLVLGLWETVYPGTPASVLTSACPPFSEGDASAATYRAAYQEEQHWGVAVGGPSSEATACQRADVARSKSLGVAAVYSIKSSKPEFQAVAGAYSSQSEAEPLAAFVRVTLHLDARAIRLDASAHPRYTFHVCGASAE
jgi:hypothetical protein